MNLFENESESVQISRLNIENRTDKITIYGDIDITRDEVGLSYLRQLQLIINDAEKILTADRNAGILPKMISVVAPTDVENPFMTKKLSS